MIWLGRTISLECAHRLSKIGMPENSRLHGHSYLVTLWWRGDLRADGMTVDEDIVSRETTYVLGALDHRFLNDVLAAPPTMEAMAQFIADSCPSIAKVTITRPTVGMIVEWVRP